MVDETHRLLAIDEEARAEIVKLKQEMAELRAILQNLADFIGASNTITETLQTLKPLDDGWGHAEDGWPWDADTTDSVTVGTRKPEKFIAK